MRIKYLLILLITIIQLPIEAKTLGETGVIRYDEIDSIDITLIRPDVFLCVSPSRETFPAVGVNACCQITITGEDSIKLVLSKFAQATIDSVLPYGGDGIQKRIISFYKKEGIYKSYWFNDDDISIHGRIIFFRKNRAPLICWITMGHIFDFDKFRCFSKELIYYDFYNIVKEINTSY